MAPVELRYSERTSYATISSAVSNVVKEPTWAMHPLQRYNVSCISRRGTSKCCLGYSSVVKFQNTREMFRFEFLKKNINLVPVQPIVKRHFNCMDVQM